MTTVTNISFNLRQIPRPDSHCKWGRCGGNLARDIDEDTRRPFIFCVQCGREHDLNGNLVQKIILSRRR
jgi:hypothetical protein